MGKQVNKCYRKTLSVSPSFAYSNMESFKISSGKIV